MFVFPAVVASCLQAQMAASEACRRYSVASTDMLHVNIKMLCWSIKLWRPDEGVAAEPITGLQARVALTECPVATKSGKRNTNQPC